MCKPTVLKVSILLDVCKVEPLACAKGEMNAGFHSISFHLCLMSAK